jgi:hypothetical protein
MLFQAIKLQRKCQGALGYIDYIMMSFTLKIQWD